MRTDIQGRLLSPEEGCGYSKVGQTRIVGGTKAKNGKFEWHFTCNFESYNNSKCIQITQSQ